MELIVTEVNGWYKEVEIIKAISRLGSASFADIQLPSKEIAPLQFQILSNPDLPTGCRVVNMADPLEIKRDGKSLSAAPYSTADISNGDQIQLGEYRVTFRLPLTTTLVRSSTIIQASLSFSDTLLQPDLDLNGRLQIKNLGDKKACQFQVKLKGFPQDCFHIDPIPLLYPGAQEEVQVQLIHKVSYPKAGLHDLTLSITAPGFYPGEEVVIKQGIYVAPVFRQAVEISDDIRIIPDLPCVDTPIDSEAIPSILPAGNVPQVEEQAVSLPSLEKSIESPAELSEIQVELQVETPGEMEIVTEIDQPDSGNDVEVIPVETGSSQTAGPEKHTLQEDTTPGGTDSEKITIPNVSDLDISKVKVVRSQADNFWTEK